jgi:hypothetical protein
MHDTVYLTRRQRNHQARSGCEATYVRIGEAVGVKWFHWAGGRDHREVLEEMHTQMRVGWEHGLSPQSYGLVTVKIVEGDGSIGPVFTGLLMEHVLVDRDRYGSYEWRTHLDHLGSQLVAVFGEGADHDMHVFNVGFRGDDMVLIDWGPITDFALSENRVLV